MILHLIESSRHHRWWAAPTLWSAGAHTALVLSLVAARPSSLGDGDAAAQRRKEVVFYLPLLPEPAEAPAEMRLQWAGMGDGGGSGTATVQPDGTGLGAQAGRRGADKLSAIPADELRPPVDESAVYLAEQLDVPVERDPTSSGPRYPEPLRATNTEGAVTAEWVVDTTGAADTATFRVLASSHPLFADAVRETLPGMHFRPAELNGMRVRQLVRQEFRFQLTIAAAPDSAPRPAGRRRRRP